MQTQMYIPQAGGASLLVVESENLRVFPLDSRPSWLVGRYDPNQTKAPDITFSSYLVSRVHGWLQNVNGTWYFLDSAQNKNGTFYNGQKLPRRTDGRHASVALRNGDILRIDASTPAPNGVTMVFTTMPLRGKISAFPLRQRGCSIGRDSRNDICESLAYFSARHAQIRWDGSRHILQDGGSMAGTYVNGQRLQGPVALRERDIIAICDKIYFYLGDKLLYFALDRSQPSVPIHASLYQRPVVLKADILTKQVKDNAGNGMKELIRDIHLQVREGTLVALLGTAGAGKSTIMNCMNGMDLKGVHGSVIYRGTDLMHHFDQVKYLIGSVPQEKTFHPDFSPEQEFRIAAVKRLPADTTPAEIAQRVETTLKLLGIYEVRKSKNSKLSGGEKTRVNIGIELVADRDLLCLDEPDQGLDPKYKHEVFRIMRDLAHKNGKTVLSIIHDVSEIDIFDQVIMLVKSDGVGRLAFSGTPEEMRRKFGVDDIRAVYRLLEENPRKYVI